MLRGGRKGQSKQSNIHQAKTEGPWKDAIGFLPNPGGGASFPVNPGIQRPTLTITLLRWGFLVTSYPRFFRGTGRGGPDLEWQPWAGAEGAWSRRLLQAMRGKEVSRAPVPSAAPMVLAQTWNQGETKVRGAL